MSDAPALKVRASAVWLTLTVALAFAATLLLILPVAAIPLRIPGNYNEGWGAFFAGRAMSGGVLYPRPEAMISDNYPPLGFYLVGAAGSVWGDMIAAGRAVALVSLLATAGLVYLSASQLGERRWAAFSGLVFLVFNLGYFQGYVAMADPQWLGEALMTAGLPLLLARTREGPRASAVIAACLLMAAGGLVKQNLLALPIAASLWLLLRHRGAFRIWAITAAVAVAGACLWIRLAYGADGLADIVGHQRRILLEQLPDAMAYLAPMIPLIAAAVWLARRAKDDTRIELALIFAAVAVPLSVFQRLGEGVNINAHFEALTALSILAGPALSRLPSGAGQRIGPSAAAILIALPVLGAVPIFLVPAMGQLQHLEARRQAWATTLATVAATPGPAACEILSVCYWAGKDFEFDAFNYGQKLRAGQPPAALEQAIATRRFGQMVLFERPTDLAGKGRLPATAMRMIEEAYAPAAQAPDGETILKPR